MNKEEKEAILNMVLNIILEKQEAIKKELDIILKNNKRDLEYINICSYQYNSMRNILEEVEKEIKNL